MSNKKLNVNLMLGGGLVVGTVVIGGLVLVSESQKTESNQSIDTNINNSTELSSFKDGEYYTEAEYYVEPAGKTEYIGVTLTIQNGEIIDVQTVAVEEGEKIESEYNNKFEKSVQEKIIGKNLNQVSEINVSGSSLTSDGFNKAIDNIKLDSRI